MEPYGEVGVLMNLGGDNTGGEILKSLLTSSKMQKSETVKVNILQDIETRTQPEEQIVFQIELGQPIKSEFIPNGENIIQHIPVTYLTADSPNLTQGNNGTLVEPVTYVLSRDVLPETSRYCTVGNDDPQKVFLVQEVDPSEQQTLYGNPERKVYAVKGSQTGECRYPGSWNTSLGVDSTVLSGVKHEGFATEENLKENKKRKKLENATRGKQGKRDEEAVTPFGCKAKAERKVSSSKRPINKRKSSKLKSKIKDFPVKNRKKPEEKKGPKEEEEVVEEEDEDEKRRNLFELTKLEDNVDQVARRLKIGCECSDSNCFDGLNPNDVFKHRLNIADLTKAEHDMYLMGVIMASIHNLEETCRHKERIRIRSCYAYQGKKVCLTAFLYLQHVTLYQMKRLRSHLKNHGVSPRIHGNRGRKPANTFSLDIYRRATTFVQSYIEEHCMKTAPNLPNRLETWGDQKTVVRKENKPKTGSKTTWYHLPPECTKRTVHGEYKSFCENFKPSQKVMKYSTFTNFLKKQFPNVKFHKREEKKGERGATRTEDAERWKQREKHEEGGERKAKEEPGVDKSIQVDKTLVYIPAKRQMLISGQRVELYDESGVPQRGDYGVGHQGQVPTQSYNSHNSEQYYAIDSTV